MRIIPPAPRSIDRVTQVEKKMTTKAPERIETNQTRIACNGDGGGVSGHPNVWLEMGEEGHVQCPYCSRLFVLKSKGGHS